MSVLVRPVATRAADRGCEPGQFEPARLELAMSALGTALDAVLAALEDGLTAQQCESALAALERHGRRLSGARLRVLAAAHGTQTAQGAGFASTEAWVARRTQSPRGAAARQVGLATELERGHDAVSSALADGVVSTAHAAVIVGAVGQLPPLLGVEKRRVVEEALVAEAQRLDPDQLRRRARRVLETVEPDRAIVDAHEDRLVRDEEEAAREKCLLSLHDNGDGTTSGHFTVPTFAAAVVRKVIDSMTSPRRMRLGATQLGSSQEPAAYDWRKRRGIAFADLLEHLPTDHLHPKTAATVVVTIDHTTLGDALKVAGLDSGEVISSGQARRLACNAAIIPAVLGSRSVVLDLGRESRLFSEPQRIAAGLTHDTCAADGCERPYAWCELHHRDPWSLGGRTDLRDAVPLCHWHHQRIHDRGFGHTYLPDGSIRFRRCS